MGNFIISGVGPGMGCSIAREFKSHGERIALISRSDFGRKLAEELKGFHPVGFYTAEIREKGSERDLS